LPLFDGMILTGFNNGGSTRANRANWRAPLDGR
jgi:hypothetical protein